MNYDEIFTAHQPSNGRAVIRSADAGRSFTDMTNDSAGNGLHPDQHALVLAPGTVGTASETFFSVSTAAWWRSTRPTSAGAGSAPPAACQGRTSGTADGGCRRSRPATTRSTPGCRRCSSRASR